MVLMPLHAATEQEVVVKRRRHIEDAMMACFGFNTEDKQDKFFYEFVHYLCGPVRSFDTYEVSLSYSDAVHQGDRRRKNQFCA